MKHSMQFIQIILYRVNRKSELYIHIYMYIINTKYRPVCENQIITEALLRFKLDHRDNVSCVRCVCIYI